MEADMYGRSSCLVTIVVPIYNEERYLNACVDSLLQQDIPREEMELILVDGLSTDRTPELLSQLAQQHPDVIRVLENPKRIQAVAMNLGARAGRGTYLVRVDAHAEYPNNYVSTCIRLLEETGAFNVGCGWNTQGKNPFARKVAAVLTSSFGVGGARFRVGGESGYVDTVPFGTFRRADFLSIGGFDERLARSEDNEINYRIRKQGGKIYMTDQIQVTYYCRGTLRGLASMAFQNGKWTILSSKLCPGSMSLKYFVPLAFVLSLVGLPVLGMLYPLFWLCLALELLLYFGLALASSWGRVKGWKKRLELVVLFPAFHVPYGLGSLAGIWQVLRGCG